MKKNADLQSTDPLYFGCSKEKSLETVFRAPTTYVAICFGWKQLKSIIPIFFGVSKIKALQVVSSIIMKEDSYSEPAIRPVEMPCSPEHTKPLETGLFYRATLIFCFYAQIICNHAPLLCTGHLQNCNHGFIFWVLKKPSHWDGTTYVLVENI